jgi:SAM-dependent methyltransferase
VYPSSDSEPPLHASETASPEQSVEDVVSGLRALSGVSPPIESGLGERSVEVERQDLRAAIYDDLYEIRQPCFRAYEDWIAEAIYSAWYEGRGRLLVVGCGTGTLLQRLVQRMPAKLITGIDPSPQMTRRAREKVPAVPEIRTVAFERYQPVVPFDVIAFNGSLAAMPDLHAAAEHIAGMTVHGSRIVISVRNGDWIWQDAARRRIAHLMHPSWYRHRLMNAGRIADIARVSTPVTSPHPLLTARQISEAFEGRFGLRDQRSGFGVTRLFESVIAVPPEQGLKTVGLTREDRPWMGSVERLWCQDEAFAKRHPMGGGILAMLFDMLH